MEKSSELIGIFGEPIQKEKIKERYIESVKIEGLIKKDDYIFWNIVETVKPFVYKYLKERFPNSLIIDEFNSIDYLVVEELLPVEIQSTLYNKTSDSVMHCGFENAIRKQLEDNIENYGKCWFFWDSEYYRYLNGNLTSSQISMNLDWLSKYVKEDRLTIFIIKYDGIIKELHYSDLEFIKNLSNTCKIEYENDERVLNRNKLKIFRNVLNGYKFTQDEINEFRYIFDNRDRTLEDGKSHEKFTNFLIKKDDKRMRLYGYAWSAIQRLRIINELLDMKNINTHAMFELNYIGIFNNIGMDNNEFVDIFNICQYFPGYIRHKEKWDNMKGGRYSISYLKCMFSAYMDKNQQKLEF